MQSPGTGSPTGEWVLPSFDALGQPAISTAPGPGAGARATQGPSRGRVLLIRGVLGLINGARFIRTRVEEGEAATPPGLQKLGSYNLLLSLFWANGSVLGFGILAAEWNIRGQYFVAAVFAILVALLPSIVAGTIALGVMTFAFQSRVRAATACVNGLASVTLVLLLGFVVADMTH